MKASGKAAVGAELGPGLCGSPIHLGAHQAPDSFSQQTGVFAHLVKTPPVRQKFLFSAKHVHSCQLGHQSIWQVPGRREAFACPATDSPQHQVTGLIQFSELL